MKEQDIIADLREQHKQVIRAIYYGHNRHPLKTSMIDLKHRRIRRRWRKILSYMTQEASNQLN